MVFFLDDKLTAKHIKKHRRAHVVSHFEKRVSVHSFSRNEKKINLKKNTCIIIKKNLDCKKINKVQHFKLAFDPNLKPLRLPE